MSVKEAIQQQTLDLFSRLGLGQTALNAYDGVTTLPHLRHLENVDEEIQKFELHPDDRKGHVFVPMIPGAVGVSYRSAILAHVFRTRGYEPIVVYCDGELDPCPITTIGRDHARMPELCEKNARTTASAFGLTAKSLTSVLPNPYDGPASLTHLDIESYRGIAVADYAKASTRKYFKKHTININNEQERKIYRGILNNAMVLVDAYESLFTDYDFAAALANEVMYIHGGVALAVARKFDVPAYSHDQSYRDQKIIFGNIRNKNAQPWFSDRQTVQEAVSTPLTDTQIREIKDVMDKRFSGQGTIHQYSSNSATSLESDSDPMIGMFTNLIWDASLELSDGEFPFSNVFEWIDTTVSYFITNDDLSLVIKTHPAEDVKGTNESVAQWILDKYGPLPSNIRLLQPETAVNSYELINQLDAGIVYNSTIGLEMAYKGVPVLVGGDTHYRDLGLTFDPISRQEYLSHLEKLPHIEMTDEMRARARRYAYYSFIQQNIDFPYISTDSTSENFEFLPVSNRDIINNEEFDFIVDRIVNDEPVVQT